MYVSPPTTTHSRIKIFHTQDLVPKLQSNLYQILKMLINDFNQILTHKYTRTNSTRNKFQKVLQHIVTL